MTNVISILSYRRGTGKSILTASLATLLAIKGKRVAIMDMHLRAPSQHHLFHLKTEDRRFTLNDYLEGKCRFFDTLCDVTPAQITQTKNSGQIMLLPASDDMSEILELINENYDSNPLIEGLGNLLNAFSFDYIFIDAESGLSDQALSALVLSNSCLILLRPSAQDYYGTALLTDFATSLNVSQIGLIINELPEHSTPNEVEKLADALNHPIVAAFPLMETLLSKEDHLLNLYEVDHPFTQLIEKLVANFLE